MQKPTLIIFTEGHPDIDTGFIAPELNIICKKFMQVFVYPVRWNDKSHSHIISPEIILKPDLAFFIKSIFPFRRKAAGLFSFLFWRNIFRIKPLKINSLLNTCGYTSLVGGWISRLKYEKSETIFYTYWLTAPTLALTELKNKRKIKYLISRIHGFDLYNERGEYLQNYFKPYIFNTIDRVYCISEFGRKYLELRYGNFSDKFKLSRLGTMNTNIITADFKGEFNIVSCSGLSKVKRIELLIDGISYFQKKHREISINWTHIGGGELSDQLKELAEEKLIRGSFHFTGTLSGNEIFELYSRNFFNCFINVSESEGIPVSIMEAQSFGIPVIATDVGGTSEIVDNHNGYLLSSDPLDEEIAEALIDLFSNSKDWQLKRIRSRENWEKNFSAESNYKLFSEDVRSLVPDSKD